MTQKELENRLNRAVQHSTPDVLDQILLACEQTKGDDDLMKNNHSPAAPCRRRSPLIIAAAAALVFCAALATWQLTAAKIPVAQVALDVNPSVEFSLNRKDRLLEITPCNADAEQLLAGLDLKDKSAEDALEELVEALSEQGYLQQPGAAVLLSVDADGSRAADLQKALTGELHAAMDARALSAEVLSQQVSGDAALAQQASSQNISFGRAAYFNKVASAAQVDPAQMAGLSLQEAQVLLYSRGLTMEQAGVECEVDDDVTPEQLVGKTLLTGDEVLQLALERASVSADAALEKEVELDAEHGRLVYDVEFKFQGMEYSFTLDAQTGEFLEQEVEPDDEPEGREDTFPAEAITREQAIQTALSVFGLTQDTVRELEAEPDTDRGRAVYEVEFESGTTEYEVLLDAVTGEVLKKQSEEDRD